jgi:hypothetical protein
MAIHPTRREILLVIILTVILGLFLQFDLSVRITESPKSDYLPSLKLGYGRGGSQFDEDSRPSRHGHESWLGDEDDEDVVVQKGKVITSMSDTKLRWGKEGPARTKVMAHAPGKSLDAQGEGGSSNLTRQAGRYSIPCTCLTELGSW